MMSNRNGNFSPSTFEQETLPQKSFLYRAAYSLLRNRGEAEDAVQETYLRAWRLFSNFQPGTNCRAWMFAILLNVVRHQRRKWLLRICLTNEPEDFERRIPTAVAANNRLTDPEILAALRALPASYAEAIILASVGELSYQEISDTVGCPIGTVMSRISRARRRLRDTLTPFAQRHRLLHD